MLSSLLNFNLIPRGLYRIIFYFKNTGYDETIACFNIYPLKHNQVIFPIYKESGRHHHHQF